MRIDIVTLFPNMFSGPFDESILKRAIDNRLIEINIHNLRDFGLGKHHVVDDSPHGGGAGMVLMAEPLFNAVENITRGQPDFHTILLTPQGRLFNHKVAGEISIHDKIILICGHYEGVDERVREHLAIDEISIGDYVLTGGELAAMVMIDVLARHIPGVLGSEESAKDDSHSSGLLEYPQYTRPRDFRGWEVPPVLLSGNHAEIAKWRHEQSVLRTRTRRPDLLENIESKNKD